MKNYAVESVKEYIRQPYAWPGGYPMVLIMDDGECLCPKCARDNFKQIVYSTKHSEGDGWQASHVPINYEDDELYCANCNAHIDCAYGDD